MDAPAVGVNAEAEMVTLEIDAQLCRPSRFAAVVAGEAVRFASPIARAEDPSQQTPVVSDTAGPHPELAGDTNEPDFATRLELFIKEVQAPVRTPLVPTVPARTPGQANARTDLQAAGATIALPPRSRCIASQKLSHVPVAKRGEGLLMCRFGLDTDAPSAALVDGKKAYDAGCKASLQPKYRSAIKELFPNTRVRSAAGRRRAISTAA